MPRLTQRWQGPDKEYVLTELTHADWLSLQTYLQYREYSNLKRAAKEFPELLDQLPIVLQRCSQTSVSMSDVDANLQQIDMIGEIVYLSARHYHTEITLAEVNGFLTVQNMMELAIIILGLSGFKDEPKKKAEVTATPSP